MKTLASLQDKMAALESNLESLATALKNRPRHDEKIASLQDKLAVVEQTQAGFVDLKAVEHLLNIRLPREVHDVEGRMTQSIAFVAEKLEAKLLSVDKTLQTQRVEALAALKNELADDLQRLSVASVRRADVAPLQHSQAQLREDVSQLNVLLERQDKRLQDAKQASAHIRDELSDTKQELTRALQTQQHRVTASLDETLTQLGVAARDRSVKTEQQLAALLKKQMRADDSTKALQDDVAKLRQDAARTQSVSRTLQQTENERLRQRLARSVAELEALAVAKAEVETRFGKKERQLQAKLKTLHATLDEHERATERNRLDLVQRVQDESKRMGVAEGQTAVLEALLATEKRQSTETHELLVRARQEAAALRLKMRSVESAGERKTRILAAELHAKHVQVEALAKQLKKSEDEATKLLEASKRDAKAARRSKAATEHRLAVTSLKLAELEKAAVALAQEADSTAQSAVSSAAIEVAEAKREAIEQLLLESRGQVEKLTREVVVIRTAQETASAQQREAAEAQSRQVAAEYELQIAALQASVGAKDDAMRRLRESLVERSKLDAVSEELSQLLDEKKALAETLARTRLEHEDEMERVKCSLDDKLEEINSAHDDMERLRATVATLETEQRDSKRAHSGELAALTEEIREVRSQIAACSTEAQTLRVAKHELENELERVQCELEQVQSEADDRETHLAKQIAAQGAEMDRKLGEVASRLDEKERELVELKVVDDANRQKLLDVVADQEETERRLKDEVDTLLLALEHERESSKTREHELAATIAGLRHELGRRVLESEQTASTNESAAASEVARVTDALDESRQREQQLQRRIVSTVEAIVQAASDFDADTRVEVAGDESDDALATRYLEHFCASQRGVVAELERLQRESEAATAQVTEAAAKIQALETQATLYSSQMEQLEGVVKQLEAELKDVYATSATQSGDLEAEITLLKKQRSELERLVASTASESEAKQAAVDRQLEAKHHQVEQLRGENDTMAAMIASIRRKMESVEAAKARELDEMNLTLSELETRAAVGRDTSSSSAFAALDKDLYASHHESMMLAQSVRSLQLQLTKSVGVVEWTDLRASVFAEEDRLERLAQEKTREVRRIGSTEDEILLNADFLNAMLTLRESGGVDERDSWFSKYAKRAPELVERLKLLESRLQDAIVNRVYAEDQSLLQRRTGVDNVVSHDAFPTDLKASIGDGLERVDSRRRLSESDDASNEHEMRRYGGDERGHGDDADSVGDDDDSEQSMQESLDESSVLSASFALDESSTEECHNEDDRASSADPSPDGDNDNDTFVSPVLTEQASAGDSRDIVDACTRLLAGHTPSGLLPTAFIPSPDRGNAVRMVDTYHSECAPESTDAHREGGEADEVAPAAVAARESDDESDSDIDSDENENEEENVDESDSDVEQNGSISEDGVSSATLRARVGLDVAEQIQMPSLRGVAVATGDDWRCAVGGNKQSSLIEPKDTETRDGFDISSALPRMDEVEQTHDKAADPSVDRSSTNAAELATSDGVSSSDSVFAHDNNDDSSSDSSSRPLERGSFMSHESDDENLAEFDSVPLQRREGAGVTEVDKAGHDESAHIVSTSSFTYRMDDDEEMDETEDEERETGEEKLEEDDKASEDGADYNDELDAVEHMLLAESRDADGDDDTEDEAWGGQPDPIDERVVIDDRRNVDVGHDDNNDDMSDNDIQKSESESDEEGDDLPSEQSMETTLIASSLVSTRADDFTDEQVATHTSFNRVVGHDSDDDDLDEVERLMQEQSGFRRQPQQSALVEMSARQAEEAADHSSDDNADELIDGESEDEQESEASMDDMRQHLSVSDATGSAHTLATESPFPTGQDVDDHGRVGESDGGSEGDSDGESSDDDTTGSSHRRELAKEASRAPSAPATTTQDEVIQETHSPLSIPAAHWHPDGDNDASDDDDEFAFGSHQQEPTLPAVPTRLLASTLAPLVLSRSRSGAGVLKKALSTARRDFDDDDDGDMDEVERLMVTQSFTSRASHQSSTANLNTVSATSSLGKANDTLGEESDSDECTTDNEAREVGVRKAPVGSSRSIDADEFEEHELGRSPCDEHDESFDDDDVRDAGRVVVDGQLESSGNLDDDDDDEMATVSRREVFRRSATLQRSAGIGGSDRYGSALEEDDDMDEVERLLLEQTKARQSAKPMVSLPSHFTHSDQHIGAGEDEPCDESADDREQFTAHSFDANLSSGALDREASGEHRFDDVSERAEKASLGASHEDLSLDDTTRAGDRASNAPSEDSQDSFGDQAMLSVGTAQQRQLHQGQSGMSDAVSDSEDDEEDSDARVPQHTFAPLQLTKSATALGIGQRHFSGLEEDDDMDEVERLLVEQTSMKGQQHVVRQRLSSQDVHTSNADSEFDDEGDDEFGEKSLDASASLMNEHDARFQSSSSHAEHGDGHKSFITTLRGTAADSDESDSDDDQQSSGSRSGSFTRRSVSSRSSDQFDPIASPREATRIPIFTGSNLVDRVATDAIPSMLTTSQVVASGSTTESAIQQQVESIEQGSDTADIAEEEDDYLEESFDLEESLQEEGGDDE